MDGLASRFPPGQRYVGGNHTKLTPKPANGHFRHLCIDCGSTFRVKRQLIAHCNAVHGGTRLSCPQCTCTLASSSRLREHVKRIHQKLARYHCEQCGKRLLDSFQLLRSSGDSQRCAAKYVHDMSETIHLQTQPEQSYVAHSSRVGCVFKISCWTALTVSALPD